MKKFFKPYILAVMALFGLISCTNELDIPNQSQGSSEISLVHAPDVVAWSGNEVVGNTFDNGVVRMGMMYSANPNQNQWTSKPSEITEAERAYVSKWFAENPGLSTEAWNFKDFYVQHVYMRDSNREGTKHPNHHINDTNHDNDETITKNGTMDKLRCGDANTYNSLEEINNFNAQNGSIMKMENSSSKKWGYHSSYDSNDYMYFKAAIINVPGVGEGYYVGLSYYAKKYDNGDEELGIKRLNYADDWIVKITPADGSTIPGQPGSGSEDDKPVVNPDNEEKTCDCGGDAGKCTCGDKCGCPDCKIRHNDEVEVNLAINDVHLDKNGERKYESSDLWTKLSIHVRKGTNVEIHIPVSQAYVVESDDFAIVQKHLETLASYSEDDKTGSQIINDNIHSMNYEINGKTVTLTVTFAPEAIIVTTSGIDQDLIDYLMEQNGDGINFEVWLYFQTETWQYVENVDDNGVITGSQSTTAKEGVSREDLRNKLNGSSIEFNGPAPKYYINAWGCVEDHYQADENHQCVRNEYHCTVAPPSGYTLTHTDSYTTHLNGTPFNKIYSNSTEVDDAHNGGKFHK